MSSQGNSVEIIIKRARNVSVIDFDNFYDKILKNIKNVESLRHLFLMLHCTRITRRLPEEVGNALLASLCEESREVNSTDRMPLLILQEVFPYPSLEVESVLLSVKPKTALPLVPLLTSQVADFTEGSKVVDTAIRFLEHRSLSSHANVYAFIHHTASSSRFVILNEHVSFLNTSIIELLRSSHQGNLQRGRIQLSDTVTEIDGLPAKEFFTILNVAQSNTDDVLTHLSGFALLKPWLSACIDNYPPSKPNYMSASIQELVSQVTQYALRVIDQCARQPKVPSDVLLQEACLLECVNLLDISCKFHPSLIPSVFSVVKKIHVKFASQYQNRNNSTFILLATVQFILSHGDSIAYNIKEALEIIPKIITTEFHDVGTGFEILQFFRKNLVDNCEHTKQLVADQFPAILKMLAFHPKTFQEEFLDLLPYFISENTVVEVFHSILDLPCLAASLMFNLHVTCPIDQVRYAALPPQFHYIAECFTSLQYKPMFQYMLRNSRGIGDSFNRLNDFYKVIQPLSSHARITSCCEFVPSLLSSYFDTVLEKMSSTSLKRLLPAVLERVHLVMPVTGYLESVQEVLAEALLKIFKLYPHLIVNEQSEIVEHITDVHNMQKTGQFFSHLVWAIGEFTSTAYQPQCTPKHVVTYYEALECIFYEVHPLLQKLKLNCKLGAILITSLAKVCYAWIERKHSFRADLSKPIPECCGER